MSTEMDRDVSAGAASPHAPARKAPWTQRAVDGLARRLDGEGVSRRSFLVRTAIVGSVLTVAPLRWALRPTSAYASVCGEGASCGSGWTAFCCTVNDGANTCPPGSYVAGWWKIDASPFCRGEPRYIVDCNRSPGSSCRCRCASGSCDQRRTCCNNFRYGQCNTQIAGVTEVVCRVVLCTAPWRWDPACGRTVRTDNRTVTHNAPCQPGTDATAIDLHYQDLGLTGSELGAPVGEELSGPRSGAWRRYERGVIAFGPATGAHALLGGIADRYRALDGPRSPLGYPLGGGVAVADGERARFERGAIYLHDGTAAEVVARAAQRYDSTGGPSGPLGWPTRGTRPVGDGRGSVTDFEHGTIYASGAGARELTGDVLARFRELGGPAESGLGYPFGAIRDGIQQFEAGLLVVVTGQVVVLRGAVARRFLALGGADGPWGEPLGDQDRVGDADRARFSGVTVFATDRTGAHAVAEPVLDHYLAEGGPQGSLGAPTGDTFRTRSGHDRGSFEGGAIEVDPSTGDARVLRPRETRSPQELTP